MTLRVLHIGNIASNAYHIAKALRQQTDIEADVYTHGYRYYLSQPEWEDADIEPRGFADPNVPDWSDVDLKGFVRPAWYAEQLDGPARRRLRTRAAKDLLRVVEDRLIDGAAALPMAKLLRAGRWEEISAARLGELYNGLAATLPTTPTAQEWHRHLMARYRQIVDSSFAPLREKDLAKLVEGAGELAELFRRYDIIQTYGVWEPMWPLLLTPAVPRVTFEHGSMREHPFQGDLLGNLLALAYKTSFRNIITNADAIHAMRRLGLDNCTFIPHPVDGEKFRPRASALREQLLREHDCQHIIFAVARHNWALKGNEKFIAGFALLKKRLGRGAKLFLADWGQEMERSRTLLAELKLEDDVVWLPPLPKRRLAQYINAADMVLDQFVLGCFGTTTPEAMACAKPVLLYYKPEDHAWCFPEHPPVLNVESPAEIAAAMERLLSDPQAAAELGERSRAWFLRHHSLDLVVQRHLEIYRAIESSPAVVRIPKEYAVMKETRRPATPAGVVAIVRCPEPLTAAGKPKYLRPICGVPVLRILADRLAKVPQIKGVILLLEQPEPETEAAARRLGWRVLVKQRRRWGDLRTLLGLATCNRVALFNLQWPFADPETTAALLDEAIHHHLSVLRVEGKEFAPTLVVTRNFILKVVLFRLLLRGGVGWRRAAETLVPLVSHRQQHAGTPELAGILGTREVRSSLIEVLGGPDFSLAQLQDLVADPDCERQLALKGRDDLYREMLRSDEPVHLNEQLNQIECRLACDELKSFPTFVGLNMTSTCNARCVFCSYQPAMLKQRDHIGLDDLKKMTWLKYVKDFAIWGGIGDSLMNPEFLDCYRYLKMTFPHLAVTFSTNGIRMNREVCDELVGHLAQFNVSLNAARKETWEKLMRSKGFDHICEQYAYLAGRRRELGVKNPRLALSMVLTRDNIEEAVEFVELAARLGADTATFVHYVSSTMVGKRDLQADSSLYYEIQKADQWLERASRRGAELGLQINRPLPFAAEGTQIHYGGRVQYSPPPCHDPWKTCYLTVDEEGRRQMIFCCSGYYYNVKYDKSDLAEDKFRAVWNHAAARYFRRTVNKPGANAICTYCQSVDRFNPENNAQYYQIGDQVNTMFQSMESKVLHFRISEPAAPRKDEAAVRAGK